MRLGNFSISLAVKDLGVSRAFYEKLGFQKIAGDARQNWLILKSGPAIIGLFQGMFDKNVMTFNPGWSTAGEPLKEFEDVRAIQKRLEGHGIALTTKADPSGTGPASFTLNDPDGNRILFDQHVPKPGK
jgi:catechol 2,3-dioxygenase-like lactoylglutathione lyase family enzyme